MADLSLLEWTNIQAEWARDALRRQALSGGRLSDNDKAEILAGLKHTVGFKLDPPPAFEHLNDAHLAGAKTTAPRVTLYSLGPVENLNRLAAHQQMPFAIDGLTVIYGDNGSGKSGYARVAKKLCRSLHKDELLGDVFSKDKQSPAKVHVRFHVEGDKDPIEFDWIDGDVPPEPLSMLSVFDSQNARLYVDKQNQISFLPTEISLLESHGAHCSELDAAFRAEQKAIEQRIKVPLPTGFSPNGKVQALLTRLDSKSENLPDDDEFLVLSSFTDDDVAEHDRLSEALKNDPATLAKRWRRLKVVLEKYAAIIQSVEKDMSAVAVQNLEMQMQAAASTAEAAAAAAAQKFAQEPLAGVGGEPWRQLYEHARAYAVSLAPDVAFLPEKSEDVCVLCQRPLSKEGAERIQRFNEFVSGAATKAADAAAEKFRVASAALRSINIPTANVVEQELEEYLSVSDDHKKLVQIASSYLNAARTRHYELVSALTSGNFKVTELLPSVKDLIDAEVVRIESDATTQDAIAKDDKLFAVERAALADLADRKKFSGDVDIFAARLEDLRELAKLKACIKAVDTSGISRQCTVLRRSLVMKDLEDRILTEIENLDLKHIPFVVSDKSEDGQSYFGVGIKTKAATNQKVLSEGEQRALALACFLAESAPAGGTNGLVIDDPVSSLDHVRIRRVAARLALEAGRGRQIIVFTHNIIFLNELSAACARQNPQVKVFENYISKTAAGGFGIISQDEPWVQMGVAKRIDLLRRRLKTFDDRVDFDNDDWRSIVKDFYSDLRESWERLVEELLLGKVIERFNAEVKTQSLKGVVVDDDDYRRVFFAMKTVSQYSGHDTAQGLAIPLPRPKDMAAALKEIDDFRGAVKKRKDETEKKRKELEEPQKAAIA